ncbi:ribosomal RNA small subunit methyltransferase B [Variibacter gotjawalensis]|uniref:Ribosomal RNA small subunit methyltransferase B n=1 Tax=Variibacter gotjawalensis TaxID=1333996 RepID=A0A0S3PQB6_9BRAD|nr:transcription antitermination factor NusB [Variibacter gotjawalensis]NIK48433.1 16S rRNA (cytosine967-C5)-methyltransferase [Variibacter gotjawalensis]RZS50300.1 16S rRNA (cytosine967-C5)-methyltransferase [Variibacter gotjawalensis]BAT58133.1 ribosomal RNA small subunit methyltransferase B [Variibacter gotjawalensis]
MARAQIQSEAPGLAARRIAADIVEGVLRGKRSLDDHFDGAQAHPALAAMEDRDRALVRMLAATVLRRLGSLRYLLERYLAQGLPKDAPRVETALLIGIAQILWLDVPDHAAVDLSVRLVQADRRAQRYPGLVNAVLRRASREGIADLEAAPATIDVPSWLSERWRKAYGDDATDAIALAQRAPPPLDITVKQNADEWAARLRGHVLPTGSVRVVAEGAVTRMPGFDEGAWWVQDAAAALPARLLGDVAGQNVADLCAAPGGKSAQLAQAGAKVTAVDRSSPRLSRLKQNFTRLGLDCEIVVADITAWDAPQFDAVLLDAPCLATGTIRRHPDVAWLKRDSDLESLAGLQSRLLDAAVAMTKPGGRIVYSVCSLEPDEGETQIASLLARNETVERDAIAADEVGGLAEIINAGGELRSLPSHLANPDPRLAGMDGFFAARLRKR